MIHMTLPLQHSPGPLTALLLAVSSLNARASGCQKHGGTLSLRLCTPPLPATHTQVGDRWSYIRSWQQWRLQHDKISKSFAQV